MTDLVAHSLYFNWELAVPTPTTKQYTDPWATQTSQKSCQKNTMVPVKTCRMKLKWLSSIVDNLDDSVPVHDSECYYCHKYCTQLDVHVSLQYLTAASISIYQSTILANDCYETHTKKQCIPFTINDHVTTQR